MKSFVLGESQNKLPIMGYKFGSEGQNVLILGGVHGDETEGIICALALLKEFIQSFPYRLNLTLVPILNIDGALARTRLNARNVDLNRNLPTNDWNPQSFSEKYPPGVSPNSESENQCLIEYLNEFKPRTVISLHSWKPLLNVNGHCKGIAEVISNITGYPIEEHIGYPTPGCLGTYCGLERDMPTLTYELERGMEPHLILKNHVPGIIEALKFLEKGNQ